MSVFKWFWVLSMGIVVTIGLGAILWPPLLWTLVPVGLIFALGLYDALQRKHAILRNFPIVGRLRYLAEAVRPEIQQYFVESDSSGRPFSREVRSIVYQRAKNTLDTKPFGTIHDLYADGTEWIGHSIAPLHPPEVEPRIPIGEGRCSQPYAASILNISAMSFGSLSRNAIRALNYAAKKGGFAHNTGEGGISPYHLEGGGDLVWQIGTGYFGCRTPEGDFDPEEFAKRASIPAVKMIEIKLSQGAKPGHGGILPAAKVTPEIAEIRGVSMGEDVLSPPFHRTFQSPIGLLDFVAELRRACGGKPVGFKLCVGRISEFMGICKAMLECGEVPDFITVDGAEGGTGAAPLEFSNAIGVPLTEGLLLVHNCLVGCGLRDQIKIIAAGKIATGFNLIQRIAIAADLCNAARAMMFALGCIQALKCNTNHCPVGVTTQDPDLVRGLDSTDKAERVYHYHRNTVQAALEILGAAGLEHPDQITPDHIYRRLGSTEIQTYQQRYDYLEEGVLRDGCFTESRLGKRYERYWQRASADHF